MAYTVVIPARYGSTRLPGKPLLQIHGKPMVQRVWEQARRSDAERVVIATDDVRIFDVARAFGADACMTSTEHPSGTDRLQQVVEELVLAPDHIVVNVQGDEPLIPPQVINQVAANLGNHAHAGIATLCEEIRTIEDLTNPNVVKVVSDAQGYGLVLQSCSHSVAARRVYAGAGDHAPGRNLVSTYWYLCLPRRVPAPICVLAACTPGTT